MSESTETALIPLEKASAVTIFTAGGSDPLLEKIEKEARSLVFDMTTDKGRKEIASMAYRIARTKTALDDMGKDLMADQKKKIDVVNAERKRVRDRLDALKDEVRAPLNEWEEADKKRIEEHRAVLADIQEYGDNAQRNWIDSELVALDVALEYVEKNESRDWQEFAGVAKNVAAAAKESIADARKKLKAHLDQQAEILLLRKKQEEREKADREAKIAEEARREAEEKAEAEKQRAEDEKAARVKAEKKAAQDAILAKQRAVDEKKKADEALKEQAAKQKAEILQASKKAAKEATEREAKRIADQIAKEKAANDKREANKRHRNKIEKAIVDELRNLWEGDAEKAITNIVVAMSSGQIPHVKIEY